MHHTIMVQGIYRRESYLSRIRPFFDHESIKVLTGIRRCGKTMILRMIRDELVDMGRDVLFEDMESNMGRNYLSGEDLYDRVASWIGSGGGKKCLLLDEIQSLDGWERCIRSLKSDFDVDIYLTGSSSKLLSGELATHLAGRYVEFRIHPFSFAEVMGAIGDGTDPKIMIQRYLVHGGMPLVVMNGYDPIMYDSIMVAMYDSVVIRDMCERNGIRNSSSLKNILSFVMSEIGHNMSSVNIANYLKSQKRGVSYDTILDYLSVAEDAMFISKVNRQDLRGKEILKTDYKFYLEDHGFRTSCGMSNTSSIDRVLENIVFNELRRRGYTVTIGKGKDSEIDFVVDKGSERAYYQVSYLLSSDDTIKREFGALENVPDNYPKFVLSMDDVDMSRNGVTHRNLVDWLLHP